MENSSCPSLDFRTTENPPAFTRWKSRRTVRQLEETQRRNLRSTIQADSEFFAPAHPSLGVEHERRFPDDFGRSVDPRD